MCVVVVVVVRCVHDWVCVKEVMGVCGGDGCVWWWWVCVVVMGVCDGDGCVWW